MTPTPGAHATGRALAAKAAAPGSQHGVTLLTLRAKGSMVHGVWAQAQVRHNGTVLAEGELQSDEMIDYRIELPAGNHGLLEVVFLNATTPDGALGRTLIIESVSVGDVVLRPDDSSVWFDAGQGAAAFDGLDITPGHGRLTRSGALRFTLPAQSGTPPGSPSAPGVYLDAQRGDDERAGTIDAPWRTLARLRGVMLPPGHGVYLRCGSVWRESLSLDSKQLVDGSVVAGYGTECARRKAVISGADDFSGGWQASAGTWTRNLPAGTPKISQLFINGQALHTAQWPNAAPNGAPAAATAGHSTAAQLIAASTGDRSTLAGKDMAGATVQMRTQPWLIETGRVTKATADGQLEIERAPAWPLDAGRSYVLQDKQWMLDAPGEFFHDTRSQTLYVIPPEGNADLNRALVEGSVRDIALDLSGRSQLVVRDMGLHAARVDGLRMTNAPGAQISQIEANHSGAVGLNVMHWLPTAHGVAATVVRDSTFYDNANYGIDATHVERPQILRNRVLGTGVGAQHAGGVIAGVSAGPGGRIEGNHVDGSGYLGIHFSSRDGSIVARNTVVGFCQRLSDCGGIYTWTGRNATGTVGGTRVENNRVLAGQADPTRARPSPDELVIGAYIDDYSHGASVLNNLIAGVPTGVLVHNASRVTVSGNRIWLPTQAALRTNMDQTDADWMVGNRFVNNEIVPIVTAMAAANGPPTIKTSLAVWFAHAVAGESALSAAGNLFDGNRVVQLQGALAAHARVSGPGGERTLDLDQWRTLNPHEPAARGESRFSLFQSTLGAELVADGRFESGISRWRSWRDPMGSGFKVDARVPLTLCASGCIRWIAATRGDLLASQPFTLRPGALYVYRWSMTLPADAGATFGSPYISRDDSPWDTMSTAQGFVSHLTRRGAAGQRLDYEAWFVAKSAVPARVNLQLETPGVPVYIDDVSVREVTAISAANISDWMSLVVTPMDMAREVDCADFGWPSGCRAVGIDGAEIVLPMSLPASAERLILRSNSPYRR